MQKWLIPVNSCFAVLIVVILALISSDLISFRLGKVFPKGAPKAALPAPARASTEELAAYAPILEKGLFGKATQGKLTPIVQSSAAKNPAATSQKDLLLLGTAVGSFRETFALVQKLSTKEERVFRLGDQVFDIGTLATVRKEMAEIEAGGKRIKIYTPMSAATEAAPAGQPGAMASQVGAGSFVVDQRSLNAALDNIGQAMTDARLLPSMKDGKVEGFKASEVKPAGIFGMIGIKNGDILLRINDFPIDSPEKAIQSFVSLKGQNKIRLDLIRDGQPATFNYDIR
jgi:general secretion pathway protein C